MTKDDVFEEKDETLVDIEKAPYRGIEKARLSEQRDLLDLLENLSIDRWFDNGDKP